MQTNQSEADASRTTPACTGPLGWYSITAHYSLYLALCVLLPGAGTTHTNVCVQTTRERTSQPGAEGPLYWLVAKPTPGPSPRRSTEASGQSGEIMAVAPAVSSFPPRATNVCRAAPFRWHFFRCVCERAHARAVLTDGKGPTTLPPPACR